MDANDSNQANDKAAGNASAAARVQRALDGGGGAKDGAGAADTLAASGGSDMVAGGVKDDTTPAAKGAADDAGVVSKKDVQKMIEDGVKSALAAQAGARDEADTRNRYLINKMGDLPPMLHDLMPKTKDLKILASAEQSIRDGLRDWFKREADKIGLKHTVGGNVRGGDALPPSAVKEPNGNSASARIQRALNSGR